MLYPLPTANVPNTVVYNMGPKDLHQAAGLKVWMDRAMVQALIGIARDGLGNRL